MSGSVVVHSDLVLDREIKQYRSWWAQDPRIAGLPFSVLCFYRTIEAGEEVSQTEVLYALEIGKDAFATAKRRLRAAGFLVEVRDRYPKGSRHPITGDPRGGQNRYQLWFFDPKPDILVPDEKSLIVSAEPLDRADFFPDQIQSGLSAPAERSGAENPHWAKKSQIRPAAENPHRMFPPVDNSGTAADNPHPLMEDTGLVRSGLEVRDIKPDQTDAGAREATAPVGGAVPLPGWVETEVDAELASLHPELALTVARIRAEVAGRVDLSRIDLVRAVNETVMRAAAKGKTIMNPAQYVAAPIVRNPDQWLWADRPAPFAPMADLAATDEFWGGGAARAGREACDRGEHDWGPAIWPEFDRSICQRCELPRRGVDPEWAAREAAAWEQHHEEASR